MTELKNWTLSQSQFSLVIVEPKGNIFFGELFTFILFEFALPNFFEIVMKNKIET